MNGRPFSVEDVIDIMRKRGDARATGAIKMHIIRAIQDNSLAGAYKVNPKKKNSAWLIPITSVDRWLRGVQERRSQRTEHQESKGRED